MFVNKKKSQLKVMSDSIKKIVVTGGAEVFTPPPTNADSGTKRRRRGEGTARQRKQRYSVTRQRGGNEGDEEADAAAPTNPPAPASTKVNVVANKEPVRFLLTPEPMPTPLKNLPAAVKKNVEENSVNTKTVKVTPAAATPTPPAPTNRPQAPAAPAAPSNRSEGSTNTTASTTTTQGGDPKVVIGAKKPRHVKVILTKKRARTPEPRHAEKGARKVQIGMKKLRKNVTKARNIRRKAAQIPIEKIRAELVKKRVIKEDSKAPDDILRQMYADAKTLSEKTL
jgi:hypothetical protein